MLDLFHLNVLVIRRRQMITSSGAQSDVVTISDCGDLLLSFPTSSEIQSIKWNKLAPGSLVSGIVMIFFLNHQL